MSPMVYLDFNAIVILLDGGLPELRRALEAAKDASRIIVPFSIEHVVETTRGYEALSEPVRQRVARLLREIGDLCSQRFLSLDVASGEPLVDIRDPFEVFATATEPLLIDSIGDEQLVRLAHHAYEQGAIAVDLHRQALVQFRDRGVDVDDLMTQLDELFRPGCSFFLDSRRLSECVDEACHRSRGALDVQGFDPKHMNNHAVDSLIAAFDERLEAIDPALSFEGLHGFTARSAPWGALHQDASHASLLASLGYWRDKASVSAASRVSDGVHLSHALRCDLFITDDARLFQRARTTAQHRGLAVRVVPLKLALEEVGRCAGAA